MNDNTQAQEHTDPQAQTPPAPNNQAIRGERVLQPLDDNVAPETPAPRPIIHDSEQTPTPSETKPDFSTIYPTPNVIGRPYRPPTLSKEQSQAEPIVPNNPVATVGIMIIGGLITVASGIGVAITIPLIMSPSGIFFLFGFSALVFQLLVGIGILRKKETARLIFVVMAIISLIGSISGTGYYIYAANTIRITTQNKLDSLDNQLKQCQNNATFSPDQQQTCATNIKKEQEDVRHSGSMKGFIPILLIGYATAIIPPIFLTRPSVKAQFR